MGPWGDGGGALGLNVDATDINAKKKKYCVGRGWGGGGDSKKKKMFLRNTSENRVCMMSMFSFFVLYNNSP